MLQPYGVPLDSRTHLTKTDWCLWSATLADNRADFEAIVTPIDDYLNQTTARLPFVDSYVTNNLKSDGCGPSGDRWRLHQDARKPEDLEEVVRP